MMRRILNLVDKRSDLEAIIHLVEEGSKVLDIGCGNGDLLLWFQAKRGISGYGIEIAEDKIVECVERGLSVMQRDVNDGLDDYPDDSFDYIILSQTLQVLNRPDLVMKEVLRVGRKAIVSVPNFGHWFCRLELMFRGHVPVTTALPYEWFNTPNTRFLTLKDFESFCLSQGYQIESFIPVKVVRGQKGRRLGFLPNLRAEFGIFVISR